MHIFYSSSQAWYWPFPRDINMEKLEKALQQRPRGYQQEVFNMAIQRNVGSFIFCLLKLYCALRLKSSCRFYYTVSLSVLYHCLAEAFRLIHHKPQRTARCCQKGISGFASSLQSCGCCFSSDMLNSPWIAGHCCFTDVPKQRMWLLACNHGLMW